MLHSFSKNQETPRDSGMSITLPECSYDSWCFLQFFCSLLNRVRIFLLITVSCRYEKRGTVAMSIEGISSPFRSIAMHQHNAFKISLAVLQKFKFYLNGMFCFTGYIWTLNIVRGAL